jgi:hypothetical protein
MSKVQLTGAFARFRGKLNRSESLVFKGCPCGKEQMAMDLLNPSKANGAKNVACQNALKTAAQAAKTALADPTERATLEAAFKFQSKYTSLFAYTVAQKYVKPDFGG